ncbi:hypothetical protein [Nonomuraea aridisoli]|uniref:hypothetical protein n=1 Tax=Nonomuraea aridisoli TaxID=2070368 RepID=UPI0015E87E5A|nr:hypothetical protein [Nonomuraea aridisoli]
MHTIVEHLTRAAQVGLSQVQVCVIGLPGVIDPVTSHIHVCYDMPAWCGDL